MKAEHFTLDQTETGWWVVSSFTYKGDDNWRMTDVASFARKDHAEAFLATCGVFRFGSVVEAGLEACRSALVKDGDER